MRNRGGSRRTGRQQAHRLLGAVALATLLAACGDAQSATEPVGDLDLSGYAPCAVQPDPPVLPQIEGLVLPPEAMVFSQHEQGPLTQVEGVVALTPLQARAFYEARADLELISAEDERVETELVLSDGTNRMFVKVQIVCATGSNFALTIGPELDADALPTPAGGAGIRGP